jgi:hypothetical protein
MSQARTKLLTVAAMLALPAAGIAAPAPARSVKVNNALYEFSYSYPAQAAALPPVKAILERDLAKTRAALISESTQDRRDAKKSNYPYRAHSTVISWKVVTALPGWLSLSSQLYAFTGGAHGNSGFDTLLWDKAAKVRRQPIDLFVSPAAFAAAVKAPFCDGLAAERKKKRGGETMGNDVPEFVNCIDPVKDAVVILGSSNGRTFTRIGFLIGPYSAGPYAEGSYEVTVPVTPAILSVVKPQFRSAFAAR